MLFAPIANAVGPLLPANRLDDINTLRQAVNTAFQSNLGLLNVQTTSTGTGADTTEDTLATFSLPAASLSSYGDTLRIRAYGTCAANANNKTMKLYFGSEVITTPTAATNAKNWSLELVVTNSGSNTQVVIGNGLVDTTAVTPYFATGAENVNTATVTIKCTGTNGTSSAGDVTLKGFIVEIIS